MPLGKQKALVLVVEDEPQMLEELPRSRHALPMVRAASVLAVALLTTSACSSTSDPGDARREGTLTIHHGDDVHSTDCRGNEILRDAQGNPTLVQDDGELSAVCFGNARLDFRAR